MISAARVFSGITVRPAHEGDAIRVGALHAASWRAHYRGSLTDAYLDGPVDEERAAVWAQRLGHPRAGQVVLLAEDDELAGFVCVFLDHDRIFGSFIDNLHVAVTRKGQGIGRQLMREAAEAMHHAVPRRPAYLFVLEVNAAARGFYERIGGRGVEHLRHQEPDGSQVAAMRYVWDSAAALIAGTAP